MAGKLTSFGQMTRKLRLDRDEFLKDMALRIGVTPAYLSAVERGRRNAPYEWLEALREGYGLTSDEMSELLRAVSESRTYDSVDITELPHDDKCLVWAMVGDITKYNPQERQMLEELVKKYK